MHLLRFGSIFLLLSALVSRAAEIAPMLPPAAKETVSFTKDVKPLLEASCIQCHAKGKTKGGLSLETREALLKGGDTGPAAIVGKSSESYIVKLVAGIDPDEVMPKKGTKWTPRQVGLLRGWIDQGMPWDAGITFAKPEPLNLKPTVVALPEEPEARPLDRLIHAYFASQGISQPSIVEDRVFARRVYLDVIGLLPTVQELDAFVSDNASDKRDRLVQKLLADKRGYADHWMTFWNDLLRNDYRGTGYIDGGRRQISGWLYGALVNNMPYDRFVAELVNPSKASEGFSRGIIWRGSVNASMLPPMQAAQNISQVFMGVNLKCASCHDSFINDWTLADAYGLAAIYSDVPMELVHCDKPTGKLAEVRFIYPQLGSIDAKADFNARTQRLAELMTQRSNGRLSRTIVNRLWQRLLGRGLVEPVDDMEKPAWNSAILDWLADDLVDHGYNLKRTIGLILTSRAYQLSTVEIATGEKQYVFRGPLVRRMTAEQFCDAISSFSDDWPRMPATLDIDFSAGGLIEEIARPQWIWTDEPLEEAQARADEQFKKEEAKKLEEKKKKEEEQAKKKAESTEAKDAKPGDEVTDKDKKPAEEPIKPEDRLARHKVVFRRTFVLGHAPTEAYAALSASQGFSMSVNGKDVRPTLSDGQRNGRIALYDLRAALHEGENTVAIDVASHTEKKLNDAEKLLYPLSRNHLNSISGMGFYLHADMGENGVKELVSDGSWSVHRAPDGKWKEPKYDDEEWPRALPLPEGKAPIDEGPALAPVARKDFANEPIEIGATMRSACTTAVQSGHIRASLEGADALMLALDRPNREQVMTVRSTAATTLQMLELTNGAALDQRLGRTSRRIQSQVVGDPEAWITQLWQRSLERKPTPREMDLALQMLGSAKPQNIADVLWAMVSLPEFQLIR